MRVAFVLSALQAGGTERVINLISTAAVEEGWDVTIISFDRPGDPIFHSYDPRVTFLRLGIPGGLRFAGRRIAALRRAFRDGGYDRIVSFLTKVNALTLAAALGSRRHITVCERNNPLAQPMHPLWKAALSLLYARADTIVLQTRRSMICLPKRHRSRAIVIPNPVKLGPQAAQPGRSRQIVAVGRLTEQKGFDLLISAFATIADTAPGWTLVIWGEGPARAVLEQQIVSAGLADRIFLPGLSAKPGSWTEAAEIFVLSSRYEGFPNALLEAMAAGLPTIAFDCEFGPAELIEDGRTGVLVRNGAVDALGCVLFALIGDRDRRRMLGQAARVAAARLADDQITRRWLKLIHSGAETAPIAGRSSPDGSSEPIPQGVNRSVHY